MDNLLIFVKLNSSSEAVRPAIEYVKDSYLHHRGRFYYTSNLDTTTISDLLETRGIQQLTGCHIVFIEYRKVPEIFIKKLYIGNITRLEQEGNSYQIYYLVKNEVTSALVIDNFMKYSTLSIERDFEEDNHISIEDSAPLMRQLLYAVNRPQNITGEAHILLYQAKDSFQNLLKEMNIAIGATIFFPHPKLVVNFREIMIA